MLCPRYAEEVEVPYPGRPGPVVEAYSPSSLPHVSAVEVLALDKVDPLDVSDYLRDRTKAPGIRVAGETARRIADLWRSLPPGVFCAPHMAMFGLRFLDGGRVVCSASLCWIGSTLRGHFDGRTFEYGFETFDKRSFALYEELQRISGKS